MPARPLASVQAYVDWSRFGVLPMPLWEMPEAIADELRELADSVGLPGPWMTGLAR